MNKIFQIIILFSLVGNINAQSQTWTGSWIWQTSDGPANTWTCFRKSFIIDTLPSNAVAKIAADSKYWLWVNGKMVIFEGGLKQGPTPNDSYYDTVDLTSYLTTGKNVLAFQVWFFGKDGFSHKNSGKGGLVFECLINSAILKSDSTWKMTVHPAYGFTLKGLEPNYRLSESNIKFDAQKNSLPNWFANDYDDSFWPQAVEKGTPPIAPWNKLWLRPIPQWKNSGLKDYLSLSVKLPYSSQTNTSIIAKLPYNAQITPYLEIEASANLLIDIRTDDYIRAGTSIRAEYITKAGTQQFEALAWMNGHYVIYTIPEGVTVKSLKYRETGYNSELSGSFESNDTFFNTLWTKAQRTLYVNMRDNYMDCPDRERALWWGDATIEIGQSFFALDRKSDLLSKKSISNLVEWQRSNNTLFSPIPSKKWTYELPIQMLAAVGEYGFGNYFNYSGDTATMIDAYPHVKSYLNLWKFDSDGLVIYRTGDMEWNDWGRFADTRILVNCWYYLALKTALEMAILSKNYIDTAWYNQKLQSIKINFNRLFWQDDVYKSPNHTTKADDRGNALAVIAGFADTAKWPYLQLVLEHESNASPYMEKYVLEALYKMGYENKALERMKRHDRFGSMVNDSCTTLYELFNNEGTYNHSWSGGPLTVLSQYGAGVAPESTAFGTYHVFPQEGYLTHLKSVTPSIKGNIIVEIDKNASLYSLNLHSPSNTIAIVGIPKNPIEGKAVETISINENKIWQDGKSTGTTKAIKFIGENNRYYKFSVVPGEYKFLATLKDTDKNKVLSIDATLASIKYNGKNLTNFDVFRTNYYIVLPNGSDIPKVTATTNNPDAIINIKYPDALPGTFDIEVIAGDLITMKNYFVKFSSESTTIPANCAQSDSISVYPVPVDDNVTITNASGLKNIVIYSLDGRRLRSEMVDKKSITINVSALKQGIYLMRYTDKHDVSNVSRFLKN